MITVTLFVMLGGAAGLGVRQLLVPLVYPEPGSEGDMIIIEEIHKMAAKEPVIQQLESDPDWLEIEVGWDAAQEDGEWRRRHLLYGALDGARGAGGYMRVWHNPSDGLFVTVVYFGPASSGWPGAVHGGLLSGVMADDSGWRPTVEQWGPNGAWMHHVEISYNRPVRTNRFHLISTHKLPPEMAPELDYDKYIAVASGIWDLAEVRDLKQPGSKPNAVATSVWGLIQKLGDREESS